MAKYYEPSEYFSPAMQKILDANKEKKTTGKTTEKKPATKKTTTKKK